MSKAILKFPSPYGVIFILTWRARIIMKKYGKECFRLLTELYSFLQVVDKATYNEMQQVCFRLLTELYSFLPYGQKSLLLQYFFRLLSCDIFIFEIFLSISVKSILNSLFFEYRLTNIFL